MMTVLVDLCDLFSNILERCSTDTGSILWLPLQWRHNGRDSVSHHQPRDSFLDRLFRRRSKDTPKLRVTGLLWGIHRGPVNSPHKGPVTRKMFPFDDVVMTKASEWTLSSLVTLTITETHSNTSKGLKYWVLLSVWKGYLTNKRVADDCRCHDTLVTSL